MEITVTFKAANLKDLQTQMNDFCGREVVADKEVEELSNPNHVENEVPVVPGRRGRKPGVKNKPHTPLPASVEQHKVDPPVVASVAVPEVATQNIEAAKSASIDRSQVEEVVKKIMAEQDMPTVHKLLQHHKAKRLSDIAPTDYNRSLSNAKLALAQEKGKGVETVFA